VAIDRRFLTGENIDFFKNGVGDASILYVEDKPSSRKLLNRFVFEKYGITIHAVSTAREGMELLKVMDFKLVFVDIMLPDISGILALNEFRCLNKNVYAKYIAISAEAHPEQIELALASGFDEYITKPIDFKLISDSIDSTLTHR